MSYGIIEFRIIELERLLHFEIMEILFCRYPLGIGPDRPREDTKL